MSVDLYIWITHWERFQHYSRRNPAWIKFYTELLHDDSYLKLTLPRRGLLHGLWLEFTLSRRCLQLDLRMINRRLNVQVKMADVKSLSDAGFIEIVDSKLLARRERTYSKMLADRKQPAIPEAEAETEEEKEQDLRTSDTSNGAVVSADGLPFSQALLQAELLAWIGSHADDRTPAVIHHNLEGLTEAGAAHIRESIRTAKPRNRAAYAVSVLKSEKETA